MVDITRTRMREALPPGDATAAAELLAAAEALDRLARIVPRVTEGLVGPEAAL
jgi:hypothetical protein